MFLCFSDVTTLSMGVLNYFTSIYSYSCYIYIWWNSIYSHLHIVCKIETHDMPTISIFNMHLKSLIYGAGVYFCHVCLKNLRIFGGWMKHLLKLYLFTHSLEIRGLCLMKLPRKTLQKFFHPFWNRNPHMFFFVFHFMLLYFFPN